MKNILGFYLFYCFISAASLLACHHTIRNDSFYPQASQETPWLQPNLLNSRRIELKFGSYGVEAIHQNEKTGLRLANLYSIHENKKIMRTFAIVQYENQLDPQLAQAHQDILNGTSIGSTLVKYGFEVKKEFVYQNSVEQWPDLIFTHMQIERQPLATVIYHLSAKTKEGQLLPYCTITEAYSPDFLTSGELSLIYGIIQNTYPQNKVEQLFELISADF